MNARGSALLAALLLMALAGLVASELAELGRRALARARLDRDGARAWYLAEAGLADVAAGLPSGHAFTDALATAPAPPPPSGDPWTWGAGFADDADETPRDDLRDGNARVILYVNAFGPPPVRRRLEALIGRESAPLQPGALVLTGDLRSLTPDFSLDGRDFDMASGCTALGPGPARPGLTLPEDAGLPVLTHPERIVGRGLAPSIARREAPSFAEVEDDARATRLAPGPLPATLGDLAAPRFMIVDGDAVADRSSAGAGVLYVTGRLRVASRLAFTGMLATAGGIDVAPGATLEVCGGAWAAGAPAVAVDGAGFVRASDGALRLAATLAPLPARARIVAVREAP
ncbi:MAG: hypothetical protein IT294_11670 [Deltaproteobacteria bacterium]|nr:hypothetical protein [Deltaproteobacteria bacterium]